MVDIRQPTMEALSLEQVLPLDLVKVHCKIDDLPGITNSQLELYRQAAFEAAELYTGRMWSTRKKIEQDIKSPRFRGISQAAIARIQVELDYIPVDGVVNIFGTADNPLFWLDGMQLPIMRQPMFQTILLPPGVQNFEMANDLMFFSFDAGRDCGMMGNVRPFEQQGARASYVAGPKSAKDVPAGVKLGCLKYIAWSVENPGDAFVPMVIRQVGVTTVSNDPAYSSGAIDEWRRHRRNIAR
jgi:hypothetical protein